MMEQNNLPAACEPVAAAVSDVSVSAPGTYFADEKSFVVVQRVAQLLSASDMVPKQYQGKMPNTVVALEIARRLAIDPFFVMQNLHVIQGRPSWSSQFIIAALNGCKRFKGGLKFEMDNQDNPTSCRAWAVEAATNTRVDGPTVSLEMAQAEGWLSRPGSKWKTMPDLMLRYRAAAFFGRLYAPDVLLGMYSEEENMEIAAQDARMEQPEPVGAVREPPLQPPPPEPEATHKENLSVAEPAPNPPDDPIAEQRAAMFRYIKELEDKKGMSIELPGWMERNHERLVRDLGGEDSEFYQAVHEHWKGLEAELK